MEHKWVLYVSHFAAKRSVPTAALDRSFRTNLQREFVVLHAEYILGEVEMWQLPHGRKEGHVAALHSERRPVNDAGTQAGRAEHRPRMRIQRRSTLLVIPDYRSLPSHTHTQSLSSSKSHCSTAVLTVRSTSQSYGDISGLGLTFKSGD